MRMLIVVKATFDDEAGIWFTESSDLPGLRIEAPTVDELRAKLPDAIADLLEEIGGEPDGYDVPIELIAHASARVRIRAPA